MIRSTVLLTLAAGLIGTAHRVHLDQGDLIPSGMQWAMLLLGSLCLCLMPGRQPVRAADRVVLTGLAALMVVAAVLDRRPTLIVAAVAAAGALVFEGSGRSELRRRSLSLVSGLGTLMAVTLALDAVALWRVSFEWVSQGVVRAMDVVNAGLGLHSDGIVMESVRGYHLVLASSVLFGFSVLVPLWALLVVRGWEEESVGGLVRTVGRASAAVSLGVLVRVSTFLLVASYMDGQVDYRSDDFPIAPMNDWLVTAGMDALGLASAAIFLGLTGGVEGSGAVQPDGQRQVQRRAAAVGFVALAAIGLGFSRVADTLGRPSGASILIDEGHSRWEPTDLQLGRDVYGQESGYNFRSLVDWLQVGYGGVRRNYEPIEAETLEGVGTLVIKTPTTHFLQSEIDVILRHVESGGGLILIGDHTNVFGTGAVLNRFGRELGFRYDYDSVFDQRQRFEQVFRREAHARHQPLLARVPKIRFEVGCSIDLESHDWTPVIVGRGLKNLPIDYKASNFYPAVKDASYMRFGQLVQMATRSYGAGRVAILSDSTLLSTFSVMLPGRRELVEAMADWVSRRDVGEEWRRRARLAGGLSFVVAFLLLRRAGRSTVGLGLISGIGIATSLGALAELARTPTQAISDLTHDRAVHFYTGTDSAFWPIEQFVREYDCSFSLFFQWTLRVGAFPRLVEDLDEEIDRANTLVLIDPPSRDCDQLERLLEFASRGGVLIALQSGPNHLVRQLAEELHLVNPRKQQHGGDVAFESRTLVTPHGPVDLGDVLGGLEPLDHGTSMASAIDIETGERRSVLARASFGEGVVVVGTLAALFTDTAYGTRYSAVPDRGRRRLFELEYDLFAAALQHAHQVKEHEGIE